MSFRQSNSFQGFTLSELLIAIGILGLIATFTIPKLIASTQQQAANAAAKEVAAAVSQIVQKKMLLEGKAFSGISPADFGNELQIVRNSNLTTDGTHAPAADGGGFWTCQSAVGAGQGCLVLNNGGCLQILPYGNVGPNIQVFAFDPDSAGPPNRVNFFLTDSGRLMTGETKGYSINASWDTDPSWFHWH